MAKSLAETIDMREGSNLVLPGTRKPETYREAARADVEKHRGNIRARASFRDQSFATPCGFGIGGYRLAIHGLAAKTGVETKA